MHQNRRTFLKNSVTLTASASMAHLMQLLFPQNKAAWAAEAYPPQRRLVWINMRGGWDTLETVDPKPTSTPGIDVSFSWNEAHTLAGAANDQVKTGRALSGLGALGTDVILVRGLAMGTTSHDAGSVYMETGILSNAGRVNAASIPTIVASESAATVPIIQLSGGGDPMLDRGLLKPVSVVRAENLDLYRNLYPTDASAVQTRLSILDHLRSSITRVKSDIAQQGNGGDRLGAIDAAETKIRAQLTAGVGSQLSLSDADRSPFRTALSARGITTTDNNLLDGFALSAKLLKENIVTCVNLGLGGFDTHSNQERVLLPLLNRFDALLKAFVDELKSANALDNTLIVLYSDFGRTPKINGSLGRDHWPVGGAALIGGRLDGGRAVGATDDSYRSLNVNPNTGLIDASADGIQLSPAHLGGAILELTLGSSYLNKRPYLTSIPALTRTRT